MIGSHAGIGIYPHIYSSDNPGTNTDIIRVDTSPYGVETATPPADFLIGHGSYVEPAPPGEDVGFYPRSRGRSTYLKLSSTRAQHNIDRLKAVLLRDHITQITSAGGGVVKNVYNFVG